LYVVAEREARLAVLCLCCAGVENLSHTSPRRTGDDTANGMGGFPHYALCLGYTVDK